MISWTIETIMTIKLSEIHKLSPFLWHPASLGQDAVPLTFSAHISRNNTSKTKMKVTIHSSHIYRCIHMQLCCHNPILQTRHNQIGPKMTPTATTNNKYISQNKNSGHLQASNAYTYLRQNTSITWFNIVFYAKINHSRENWQIPRFSLECRKCKKYSKFTEECKYLTNNK